MSSLESFPIEASSLESPKLEISSSYDRSPPTKLEISSSSDEPPPAKVDISSSESMSSEGPPLKGKALMHDVGIEIDSKTLTDHTSATLHYDSDSCDSDGGEHEFTDSEMAIYLEAVNASGGFDVPCLPRVHACGMIVPIIPLDGYYNEYLKPICIAVMDHFNENEPKKYEFVKLVKANMQLVCGIKYYLTIDAYNLEDATNQTIQALVLHGIPQEINDELNLTVLYCKRKSDLT